MLKFTAQILAVSSLLAGGAVAADLQPFEGLSSYKGDIWQDSQTSLTGPADTSSSYFDLLTELPAKSFEQLSSEFSALYQETVMFPGLDASFFPSSNLYKAFTIPVASVSRLDQGYQIEFISQFYDADKEYLLHLQQDSLMYDYIDNVQGTDTLGKDIAIGLGASYIMNKDVTVQALFSSGSIPQYSGSNFAVGVSLSF